MNGSSKIFRLQGQGLRSLPPFPARLAQVRPELGADGKNVYGFDGVAYDVAIAHDARSVLRDQNPDVVLVHFGKADEAGRSEGARSNEYREAVELLDGRFGLLDKAIETRA